MPRCYQFDNRSVKPLVVVLVHDAPASEGYRTVMATTRIGKGRRVHLYIKEWMDDRGLSDERAANRIGVARETIYRWRTEQHRLNPEKIAQLASALDIEPQELYRPPGRRSLDAMLADAPDDLHATAADIVARLVSRGN